AVERLQQQRLPFLPHFGAVVLARRVDQTGDEALERVAAQEQAKALAVAEVQDSGRGTEQIVFADLEQLVARVVVENVDELLLAVAAGGQVDAADHVGRLVPQQRDVRRVRAVGGVREQAQE